MKAAEVGGQEAAQQVANAAASGGAQAAQTVMEEVIATATQQQVTGAAAIAAGGAVATGAAVSGAIAPGGPAMEEVVSQASPQDVARAQTQDVAASTATGVASGNVIDPNVNVEPPGDPNDFAGDTEKPSWIDRAKTYAPGIAAGVGAITDYIDGKKLADANRRASELQSQSAEDALANLNEWREQIRTDLGPYSQAGLDALNRIQADIESGAYKQPNWDGSQYTAPVWEGYQTELPSYSPGAAAPTFDGYSADRPEWERGPEFEQQLSDREWTRGAEFEGAVPEWQGYDTQLSDWDPNSVNLDEDPGYAFRKAEGEKSIRRGASAGSGFQGGSTYKALTRYGQDYASNEYSKARGRAVENYQLNRSNELERRGAERETHDLGRQTGVRPIRHRSR